MGLLARDDLKYSYAWTPLKADDVRLTGKLDHILLNRKQGYEVLAFLNCLAVEAKWRQKDIVLNAERLLHEKAPPYLHARDHLARWLFSYHQYQNRNRR